MGCHLFISIFLVQSKEEYEASVCLCGSQVCRGSYLNLSGEGAFEKVCVVECVLLLNIFKCSSFTIHIHIFSFYLLVCSHGTFSVTESGQKSCEYTSFTTIVFRAILVYRFYLASQSLGLLFFCCPGIQNDFFVDLW